MSPLQAYESTGWFLNIPSMSRSLDWAPHRELIGSGEQLADFWLKTAQQSGCQRVIVLVHETADSSWVTKIKALNHADITIHFTRHFLEGDALQEAADLYNIDRLILGSLASCIIPGPHRLALARAVIDLDIDAAWYEDAPRGAEVLAITRHAIGKLLVARGQSFLRSPLSACLQTLRSYSLVYPTTGAPIRGCPMLLTAAASKDECAPIAIDLLNPNHRAAFLHVCTDYDSTSQLGNLTKWKTLVSHNIKARIPSRASRRSRNGCALPRVLYISEQSAFSGAEESLCQCVAELDRNRFEPSAIIGAPGLFARRLRLAGAYVHEDRVGFGSGFDTLFAFSYWQQALARIQPDIIHFNSRPSHAALWATVASGVPFVQHIRNGDLTGYGDCIEAAQAIVTISHYLRAAILSFAIDPSTITVIPDEVSRSTHPPITAEDRARCRAILGIPLTAPVLLMIARPVPNKRHDVLFDAFEIVAKAMPQAHLIIKTDYPNPPTPFAAALFSRIERMQARLNIKLHFFLEDLRPLYCAADCLVLCSDREGLGRCIVEAMSLQLPVIVTDSGGSHEIVQDQFSGYVVPSGNSIALAEASLQLLTDEARRTYLAGNAARYVEENLTATAAASCLQTVYTSLLQGTR